MSKQYKKAGRKYESTEESVLKRYEVYKKTYNKKEAMLKKRGYDMPETMYSFEEYKATYNALKNDVAGTVDAQNINRLLVDRQTYSRSKLQAKGIQQVLAQKGIKAKLIDIRLGNASINGIDIDEVISDAYHNFYNDLYQEYKSRGKSTANIAALAGQYIGQTFFGSN